MNTARAKTVLVHGLWMHGMAMGLQRLHLTWMGFDAVCYSYPTVRCTLTENAERLAHFARTLAAPVVHWVGHSLGGIVILRLLEREPALAPGRVVLLGPPCTGSHAGDELARSALGAGMLGRSMREWLACGQPPLLPQREIGVIAGSLGVGLGRVIAPGLPLPNDGAVALVETELECARDRIVLPVSHSGMLMSRRVAIQIAAFLRDGRFDHGAD